jgi:hypothetical protein
MGNNCCKFLNGRGDEGIKHSNEHVLCEVLGIQKFDSSDDPKLEEKLGELSEGSDKFVKIHKKLCVMLGNGRVELSTIPDIVDKLMPRNYPEVNDFDGSTKIVTFVPDWYLTTAVRYVDPSRGPQLQKFAEEETFESEKRFFMGGRRQYSGEVPERALYDALQKRFRQSHYFRSRTEFEIWADFGPVGNTKKIEM